MKNPPADLARRLLEVSEQVLHSTPPLRLEDVAALVGASRATLYYYFAGRDDLLTFLLTTHARHGAEAVQASMNLADPPEQRLRAMVTALAVYLGQHPGICAGLLNALGAAGRMSEALDANETWIAGPLRDLLTEGRAAGTVIVDNVSDAANAMLGALLLAVLGRSMAKADPPDQRFYQHLTEQVLRGVLTPRESN